jgi:putative peptidoglycan binding protein
VTSTSFAAESVLLGNTNFNRADLRQAITEARQNLSQFQHKDGPGAQKYSQAVQKLEDIYRNTQGSGQRLSDNARQQVRDAARDVGAGRLSAQRENLPNDQYTRNQGDDPGIYRERESGEIVRRDPGARTATEKAPATTQNPGEDGVHRDPGTGQIIRRDGPNSKTALEKDPNDPYNKSNSLTYRNGPNQNDVETGRRNMREGDKGAEIKKMQERLKTLGYDLGPKGADGFYGPKTAAAVDKFLKDNNLGDGRAIGESELNRMNYLLRQRTQPQAT